MILIGVDTGGTFTDFIYKEGEHWRVYKTLSTPSNPADAVINGIFHILGGQEIDGVRLVHGSTVATNAILERKGARTALITNRGFEDVIAIGRQNRVRLYDLSCRKNPPLAPDDLRFGIDCRMDHTGAMIQDLNEDDIHGLLNRLSRLKVESIAVSFLFAFENPAHEKAVGALLSGLDVPVSLSHHILNEFREYERTSTTLVNAYVSPKMNAYLKSITGRIGRDHIRIMQSNGGSISAETAMRESVRTILSGPAGGAVGAYEIGKAAGFSHLIAFDMGGTSTDVSLIEDGLPLTTESVIAQFPVKVPMIDIHTVGAGGGSVAAVDAGGALRVGPESAGADPGPICFGKGSRITVTDANLFLGRLIADRFLGGGMTLCQERLPRYFESMATRFGLTAVELAEGILDVANTAMERAIRVISVEKGIDPKRFTLFSFGGAGGMHAVFLARMLNIPRVLIPRDPGILSAMGMLLADVVKDYSQTVMLPADDMLHHRLEERFRPLERRGAAEMQTEGLPSRAMTLIRTLDMRYRGQSHEIQVPFSFDTHVLDGFHRLHEKTYGYCKPQAPVEVVSIRLRVVGRPEKPEIRACPMVADEACAPAVIGEKTVIFDGRSVTTPIVDREKLKSGQRINGPAILVEYSSTVVLPPGSYCRVDGFQNLIITMEEP